MGFIILLLKFIGLLCYVIAGIAGVVFMINLNENGNFKLGVVSFVIGASFIGGGILANDYSKSLKVKRNFMVAINNGIRHKVRVEFMQLPYSNQEKYIDDVFEKCYDKSFQSLLEFVKDYETEYLDYVEVKKVDLENKIAVLYDQAERTDTPSAWRNFIQEVSGETFLNYANTESKNKEFAKWIDEQQAWNRVLMLNSIILYREFLSRFPSGEYEEDVRKIILDNHYDSYTQKKPPFKIYSDFSGTTILNIENKSNTPITFSYNGTFEKGKKTISGYGYACLFLPNGYYSFSATAQQSRVRNDYSLETLNGRTKTLQYYITQDYR